MEHKERYAKIISHFGLFNQCKIFNGEAYELIEAMMCDYKKEAIINELADCFNLLYQFMTYFDVTDEELQEELKYKLRRTEERIKEGYYDRKVR